MAGFPGLPGHVVTQGFPAAGELVLPESVATSATLQTRNSRETREVGIPEKASQATREPGEPGNVVVHESELLTFPSGRPDRQIDYIFASPGIDALSVDVVPGLESDHLPLVARLRI